MYVYVGTDKNFGELKQTKHALPFGHFPILTIDGKEVISDSIAMQLYICAAEKPELIPSAPIDQARALSVANTTEARYGAFVSFVFAPDEASKQGNSCILSTVSNCVLPD